MCHIFALGTETEYYTTILCLTSRTTMMSARIPDEYSCHGARNLCVFSHIQKGTLGFTHRVCVLQRVSLGALSDVTVVLGMKQSIDDDMIHSYETLDKLCCGSGAK